MTDRARKPNSQVTTTIQQTHGSTQSARRDGATADTRAGVAPATSQSRARREDAGLADAHQGYNHRAATESPKPTDCDANANSSHSPHPDTTCRSSIGASSRPACWPGRRSLQERAMGTCHTTKRLFTRRLSALQLVALAAAIFVAGGLPSVRNASATGDPPVDTSIVIPGTQPWTDTGLDLPPATTVTITATGFVRIAGSDPGRGPEGSPPCVEPINTPAPGLACLALVGRIANGLPFVVGTGATFASEAGGRLYLGENDTVFGDNSGSFTAHIVYPSADPLPVPPPVLPGIDWSVRSSMPNPRVSPVVTAAPNGHIFVAGGAVNSGPFSASFEEYDPGSDTWVERAPLPTSRYSFGMAALPSGNIVIAGGYDGALIGDVDEYDPGTNAWSHLATLPAPRRDEAVFSSSDGRIYVIGGTGASGAIASVDIYDPSEGSWTTGTAAPVAGAVVDAATGGKFYAMGRDAGPNYYPQLEVYDPASDSWTVKSGTLQAGGYPALVAVGSKLVALGGFWNQPLSNVDEYDPAADSWTAVTAFSVERYYPGAAAVGNDIFLFGGGDRGLESGAVEHGRLTTGVPAGATKLVVTNTGDNTISIIDPQTPQTLATIPVGASPRSVTLDAAGTRAYVNNLDGQSISVVDLASDQVIATIPLPGEPFSSVMSPDGARLYVADYTNGTVDVVDTTLNAVIHTIPGMSLPQGMALSADGARLYIVNDNWPNPNGFMSVVDTNALTVIASTPVGEEPTLVALSPDNARAYVLNNGGANNGHTVSVIDTASHAVVNLLEVGTNPYGIEFSPDGTKFYVMNTFYWAGGSSQSVHGTISVFDAASDTEIDTIEISNGYVPNRIAISADGTRLYATLEFHSAVSVIDLTTDQVIASLTAGSDPYGIAVIPQVLPHCQPGTYSSTGSEPCTPAPAGTFVSGSGAEATTLCEPGSYQDQTGQTSCIPVPAGSYASGSGATSASLCAPGSYQDQTGQGSCVLALAGSFVAGSGATSATLCAPGTFSGPGAVECSSGEKLFVTHDQPPVDFINVLDSAAGPVAATIPATEPRGIVYDPQTRKVYVADTYGEAVLVLDAQTDAELTSIPIPGKPLEVFVSPDGSRVYTANWDDQSVTIIDTATNSVVRNLTGFVQPRVVATGESTGNVYVLDGGANGQPSIVVYSPDMSTVLRSIPLPDFNPPWMTLSADESTIWVSDGALAAPGANTISVLDVASGAIVGQVGVCGDPGRSEMNRAGTRLYGVCSNYGAGGYADLVQSNLFIIDTASRSVIALTPGGYVSNGMALSLDESRVYFVSRDGTPTGETGLVMDAMTGAVLDSIPVGPDPYTLVVVPIQSSTGCEPGFYSSTGSEPCTPAPAGTFVSGSGATEPTDCAPGSFQDQPGQTMCYAAPAGSYVPDAGATSAVLCLPGTFSNSAGSIGCTPAPAGSYAPGNGNTSAVPCPEGTTSTEGASLCTEIVGTVIGVTDDSVPLGQNASSFVSADTSPSDSILGFDVTLTFDSNIMVPDIVAAPGWSLLTICGTHVPPNCAAGQLRFAAFSLSGCQGICPLFAVTWSTLNSGTSPVIVSAHQLAGTFNGQFTGAFSDVAVVNGSINVTSVDQAAPIASPTITPSPNGNGWNNSDVTASWNWSDGTGSGIDPAHCIPSSTSSGDGPSTLTATCEDLAGNIGTASYSVNIDKTAPVAAPTQSPPANANGWNTRDVTVDWNWTDVGGSGVDHSNCTTSTTSSGQGTLTLTASCTDGAGNTRAATYTARVDKSGHPGYVFVVDVGANYVDVFNTDDGSFVKAVLTGENPINMVATRDGTKVYVANGWSNTVSVIDVSTLTVVKQIQYLTVRSR